MEEKIEQKQLRGQRCWRFVPRGRNLERVSLAKGSLEGKKKPGRQPRRMRLRRRQTQRKQPRRRQLEEGSEGGKLKEAARERQLEKGSLAGGSLEGGSSKEASWKEAAPKEAASQHGAQRPTSSVLKPNKLKTNMVLKSRLKGRLNQSSPT